MTVAAAVLCLPACITGLRIERGEGVVFLGWYAAYTTHLILEAKGHPARAGFRLAAGRLIELAGAREVEPLRGTRDPLEDPRPLPGAYSKTRSTVDITHTQPFSARTQRPRAVTRRPPGCPAAPPRPPARSGRRW